MAEKEGSESGRVGLNVSLTPELARLVNERVRTGLYGTASEVVRESLRHYFARSGQRSATNDAEPRSDTPTFRPEEWAELRAALLSGEALLADERSAAVSQLFAAGIELVRTRLATGGATRSAVEKQLAQWLRERAGATSGDGPGVPVSPERIARILGG